jgi:hypothetical protein
VDDTVVLDKVISEDLEKFEQVKLVVSEFRGKQYLHLRKYYLTYESEWMPTKDGVCIEICISNIVHLFEGLVELLAESDVLQIVLANLEDDDLKKLLGVKNEPLSTVTE